jgi:hypothetical protein
MKINKRRKEVDQNNWRTEEIWRRRQEEVVESI